MRLLEYKGRLSSSFVRRRVFVRTRRTEDGGADGVIEGRIKSWS